MKDRSSGAGELPVDLECGFVRPEADRCVELVILCKAQCEFLIDPHGILRLQIDREVDHASVNARQLDLVILELHFLVCALVTAQVIEFTDRSLVQDTVLYRELARQGHLTEPRDGSRVQVAGIPVLHPADHDPAAIRRENGLRCVKINSVVDGMVGLLLENFLILIVFSDHVESTVPVVIFKSLREHILRACEEDLLPVQLKEIRALPHKTEPVIVLHKRFNEFPVDAVLALIEKHPSAVSDPVVGDQTAVRAVRMLPDLRIPERIAAAAEGKILLRKHRVPFIFRVIHAITEGKALGLYLPDFSALCVFVDDTGVHQEMLSVRKLDRAS